MDISQLMEQAIKLRNEKDAAYKAYQDVKDKEQAIKNQVAESLSAVGLKQAKSADGKYSAHFTQRTDVTVTDIEAVRDWINSNGVDSDAYFRLDKTAYNKLALEALKTTGENPAGTEFSVSESFTIKENKK